MLLDNPQKLYVTLSPEQRRYMNDAICEKLYVHDNEVDGAVLKSPFDDLVQGRDEIERYASDLAAAGKGMKTRRPDVSN